MHITKLLPALIGIYILASCASKKTDETPPPKMDSISVEPPVPLAFDTGDSIHYIGYIDKFQDSTFYTDLFFVDDFDYEQYTAIVKMGTEVTDESNEVTRTLIPIEKAGKFFDLTGLARINIYNKRNQLISTATFDHIEHLDDMITGSFIAVFKCENPTITDFAFCIGNSADSLETAEYPVIENTDLNVALIDYLQVDSLHAWQINHYAMNSSGRIYSTVSEDTTAFIIETVNDSSNVLYRSHSSEMIMSLTPVSKKINGRPILLARCALPETDITWTSLLVFNGTQYEPMRGLRLKEF